MNADDQTVTQIAAAGGRPRAFATGGMPTDLAAAGTDLWVAEGQAEERRGVAPRTRSLAHVAARMHAVRAHIALPARGNLGSGLPRDRVAVSRRAVWVIGGDGSIVQVDPLSGEVVRVLPYPALALAARDDRVWALTRDRTVVSLDERGMTSGVPIDVPGSDAGSMTVGGGAVWISDPASGQLVRIEPDAPGRRGTTSVGAGLGELAYGHGAVWAVDPPRGRILRVDASTGAVTGEVAVGGIPRDVAVSDDGVWVSVAPSASARQTVCGRTIDGGAPPDVVMVADLPLRGAQGRPIDQMVGAIEYVVTRHHHRAGKLRVGYRVCDDSTSQSSSFDENKCVANARAYGADRRVVIEIGPYTSGCALRQLPVAGAAPDGPLPIVSPTNTAPELTRDIRPGTRRAYARVIARDDRQSAAMVAVLRRRGHRDVFVLDDATGSPTYGLELASYFALAARSGGLNVVGRASWPRQPSVTAVARRVARARPDAVYVSGMLDSGAGEMVRALRRALPASVTVAGPDLLLPLADFVHAAGPAARGVLVTTSALPVAAMPERAQALAAELAQHLRADRVHPYAVYTAQATEVALDAVARSDGSRSSVARALLATKLGNTPLGPVEFTARGDLRHARVAVLRVRRAGGSHGAKGAAQAALIAVR